MGRIPIFTDRIEIRGKKVRVHRSFIFTVTYILLAAVHVSGIEEPVEFRFLQSTHGLSQNDILSLFQDSRGFIWIGTNDGLNRYDGYNLKVFRHQSGNEHSISSNLVNSMNEDPLGNLWIGTIDAGLCMFDRKSEKFYSFEDAFYTFSGSHIRSIPTIYVEDEYHIWIGSTTGLYLLYSKHESGMPDQVRRFDLEGPDGQSITDGNIFKILKDSAGNLWVCARSGLYLGKYEHNIPDAESVTFERLDFPGPGVVLNIVESDHGMIVSGAGLWQVVMDDNGREKPEFRFLLNIRVRILEIDKGGNLWAGSNGLWILEESADGNPFGKATRLRHQPSDPNGLSSNFIRSILVDREGLVWIGTRSGGVSIYSPDRPLFRHYTATGRTGSLPARKVLGIYRDSIGNIWTGTDGGDLVVLPSDNPGDFESGYIQPYTGPGERRTHALAFDEWNHGNQRHDIIFGGGGPDNRLKIFRISGDQIIQHQIIRLTYNDIFAVKRIGGDELWVGTYGNGLFRLAYVPEQDIYETVAHHNVQSIDRGNLSSNIVRSFLEDSKGNVWIGTEEGLNYITGDELKGASPSFKVYKNIPDDPSSLSHNYVIPLYESSSGEIWVGTLGGGLNRIVSSESGKHEFQRITTQEGLPNDAVKSIIEDNNGFIWVSTNKGLTRIYPETLEMRHFGMDDGLQDLEFSETCCTRLEDGSLVFGGVNGLNVFNPDQIPVEPDEIPVVLTEFYVLNKLVEVGQEFNGRVLINASINETSTLRLRYRENSFSIGFSDLQYFRTSKNVFRYRLKGFDEDWVVLGRDERMAKYTNVPSGKHLFQVMATDIDGMWNMGIVTELEIKVKPPLWRTPVAAVVYLILLILSLILFRRYTIVGIEEKNRYEMEIFQKEQNEQLTQAKLRFFTNISHEFRSPLTLIVGPIERLMKGWNSMTDMDRNRYLRLMRRNSQLMLRLIDQLMDFRKMEHGKMTLQVSMIQVAPVLDDVYYVFEELARSRSINFSVNHLYGDLPLWCDLDKLEKILYNLLSNAFKYVNDKGYVRIDVEEVERKGKECVAVRVTNSGKGISEVHLAHVFDRFRRYDYSIHPDRVGTGIGLAFTKTLVEMHKGEIIAESTEGVETSFTVYFLKDNKHFDRSEISTIPVASGSLKKIAYEQSSHFLFQNEGHLTDDRKDEQQTILVVEDNPEVLHFLVDSLSENYKVYSAPDGKEGLDLTLRIVPDLIIADIIMPVMDGYALCKCIKSDEKVNHIPMILLTSKSTEADQVAGFELGAEAYVSKPFSIDVLEAQIRSLLEARGRARVKFSKSLDLDGAENEDGFTSLDIKFLDRLTALIEQNIDDASLSVKYIAGEVGMSQILLNKKLKAVVGMTANTFIRNYRLKKAASLIEKNRYFVSDVAYEVGFNDVKYFRTCFKNYFNLTPTEFAKLHESERDTKK